MSRCNFENQLSAYYDGELDSDRRAALDTHLGGCRICTEALAELRAVSSFIGEADVPILSETALRRVHRRISQLPDSGAQKIAAVLTAAAAVLLVAGSILAWRFTEEARAASDFNNWERAAVMPQVSESEFDNTETEFASWMVLVLSNGGRND